MELLLQIIGLHPTPGIISAWIPAAIAAGAAIAGAIHQNESNRKEARKNRDFQKDMSNTSHQREVRDLEAAGLNPILSANNGASTPPGGAAQQENVTSGAISSALEAKQVSLMMEKQKEEVSLLKSQKNNTDADTNLKSRGAVRAEIENEALKTVVRPIINKIHQAQKSSAKDNWDKIKKNYPEDPSKAISEKSEYQQPLKLR